MPTSIRKKKKLSNQAVCVSNSKNVSKNVIFFSKIDFTQKNPKKTFDPKSVSFYECAT